MIQHNQNERPISLQISKLKLLPEGDYLDPIGSNGFLIKNITDSNITLSILLLDSFDYIDTIIYPGWNPELVKGIKNVPKNSIQIGN